MANERPKELKMQRNIFMLLGTAVIAVSAAQVALAAQPHRSHVADRARVKTHEEWRNSNAYTPSQVVIPGYTGPIRNGLPSPPVLQDQTPSYDDPSRFGGA
jgi:hypothetical protein